MVAERDRHGPLVGRLDRRGNRQRRPRQGHLDAQLVSEREGRDQRLVGGEVEAGGEHRAVRRRLVTLDAPPARRREQTVHRAGRRRPGAAGWPPGRRRRRVRRPGSACGRSGSPTGRAAGCPSSPARRRRRAAPAAVRAAPRRGGAASTPPSPRRGRTSPRCRRPPVSRASAREARRRRASRSSGSHQGDDPIAGLVTGGGLPRLSTCPGIVSAPPATRRHPNRVIDGGAVSRPHDRRSPGSEDVPGPRSSYGR